MYRLLRIIAAGLLSMLLACSAAAETAAVRPQDDFYSAVNAQWLSEALLSPDQKLIGSFMDLSDLVEAQLISDFDGMASGKAQPDSSELAEFIKLYAQAADYEARNTMDITPLREILNRIASVKTFSEMDAHLAEWTLMGLDVPFVFTVEPDMRDTSTYALYAAAPKLFLGDAGAYRSDGADKAIALFEETAADILVRCGLPQGEAEAAAQGAAAFDSLLAPYARTSQEDSDTPGQYNPVPMASFAGYSGCLSLDRLVKGLTDREVSTVVLSDPRYYQALDELINEQTFPQLKSWILVSTAFHMAPMLSEETMRTAARFTMALYGQEEMPELHRLAYRLVSPVFDQAIGRYYGQTRLSEAVRENLTNMANTMIALYRKRLAAISWLSGPTIQAALRKLDKIEIMIGYPDAIAPVYSLLKIMPAEEGGSLLTNMLSVKRVQTAARFALLGETPDPALWPFSADVVNAMYDDTRNAVFLPAAILQPPFYSPDQSASRNYGAIGAVIAHEITHAFDSNGARYDAYGNLKSWWTDEDFQAFEARTKAMIALFDGLPSGGGAISGQLTVTENTADSGGLRCALEAVKSLPEYDLKDFFAGWAAIWRSKATPELEQLLLLLDPHAPAKLRVNVQLQTLDDFYAAYGVNPGDGMYLPPEKRVSVW